MDELRISAHYFSPAMTKEEREKVRQRMYAWEDGIDSTFGLNVSIFGKVGMVICWYYDGNMDGTDDLELAAGLVAMIPDLMAGRFEEFSESDLYWLHDALASFPIPDPDLQAVSEAVYREWSHRVWLQRRLPDDEQDEAQPEEEGLPPAKALPPTPKKPRSPKQKPQGGDEKK